MARPPKTLSGYPTPNVNTNFPCPSSQLLVTVLTGFVLVTPSSVLATPTPRPSQSDRGAYLQISPGIATVVMDQHRFSKDARWSWPWALGVGGMVTRGTAFKATLGVGFEHCIFLLEDVTVHGLRTLLESRIGGGNRRMWGYGLVGLGAASTVVDFGIVPKIGRDRDTFFGVAVQYGGGIHVLVGRRFFIGGELDFDLGYHLPNFNLYRLDDFYYHAVSMKLVFGWSFIKQT